MANGRIAWKLGVLDVKMRIVERSYSKTTEPRGMPQNDFGQDVAEEGGSGWIMDGWDVRAGRKKEHRLKPASNPYAAPRCCVFVSIPLP